MKAYSVDLRQKIIDIYTQGNISQRKLAQQFHVALSFIQKLLKQYRQSGNIAPLVRNQQTPTKLNTKELNILQEIVLKNNDATLEELRHLLVEETGKLIGRSTLDRMIRRLNLTRKKKHYTQRKKEQKKFKNNV